VLIGGDFFAVQPDLMVCRGTGKKMVRQFLSPLVNKPMLTGKMGIDRADYLAIHVSAGSQCCCHRGIYRLHGGLEIPLDDSMPLESLPRRYAKPPGRPCGCDPVQLQPLFGGHDAARQAGADHERISRLKFALAPFVANVAVVLLIAAVKFQEFVVIVADGAGNRVVKAFLDSAAKVAAIYLDLFQMRKRGGHAVPDFQYTSRA